jgi:hypothetical protein
MIISEKCKFNIKGGCYKKMIPHNNPCAYCFKKMVDKLK